MISLSFLLLLLLNLVLIKTELKFVYEVFRHGARSPWAPGNKGINETRQDIYGEYWFNSLPGLESELTSMGMRQHYLLGYKMRSKYVDTGFLDKSFNMSQLLIFSTNINRTILSAQSQLFGIYPPGTGNQIFANQSILAIPPGNPIPDLDKILTELQNNSLLFGGQVFPVHLFEEKYEALFLPSRCPPFADELKKNEKNEEILAYIKEFNATYYEKLQKVLGFKDKNYLTIPDNLLVISDTYVANYFEGRKLLSLVNAGIDLDEFYKQTKTYLRLNMLKNFGDKELKMAKVTVSKILAVLIDNLDWVVEMENKGKDADWTKRQKFLMHSMHDTNLYALLTLFNETLKTGVLEYSQFASNMIFEFEKPTTNKTEKYVNSDFNLTITYNDRLIYSSTYDKFRDIINPQLMSNEQIDNFCNLTPGEDHLLYIIIIIVLSVVVIIQLIAIIFVVRKRQSQTSEEESLQGITA